MSRPIIRMPAAVRVSHARFASRPVLALLVALGLLPACGAASVAQTAVASTSVARQSGHAAPGMLRNPDVSATHVVFAYADDLWLVSREGGQAVPLASPPGPELSPRFSPDGGTILFSGNYDGGRDLFTLPVSGGVPTRLTHHPAIERQFDWAPDGRVLFSSGHESSLGARAMQVFTLSAAGGLPERLPVPYGGNAALSADGRWLAYVPVPFDTRTWKRYAGGTAMDVWLFDLVSHESLRMTEWEGSDTFPMWQGSTVYYLSDAGEGHLLGVWAYDTASGARRQVTNLDGFDVRWPAIGPGPDGGGEIVFQHGSELKLLDLATETVRTLEVTIPGDRPALAPQTYDVADAIEGWSVSPSGKRVVVEARGDVWTLPRKDGAPRNLTGTDGEADRNPAWSPDGRWVACSSDRSGEYEIWLLPSDGKGEPRQLTRGNEAWFNTLTWAPDSERLAFYDQTGRLLVHVMEEERTLEVARDPYAGSGSVSWSHDGTWLAYTLAGENLIEALWLWDAVEERSSQVTAGRFNDGSPCFDREGKYLYLVGMREWSGARYDDLGSSFVYAATERLLLVPLRDDVPSPWLAKSDEEPFGDDDDADDEGEDEDSDDEGEGNGEDAEGEEQEEAGEGDEDGDAGDEDERLLIDVEGFERRATLLPVERGNFGTLAVTHDGKLVYQRYPPAGEDGDGSVHLFDVEDDEAEEQTLVDKADGFELSADGKTLLVVADGKATLRDPKPGAEAQAVPTAGMRVTVDPRAEWGNVYVDAWRRFREWFYDPGMHGVDWAAMRAHYEPMLADCVSRRDVGYVIRELISELNVGHAYYRGADEEGEGTPTVPVGLLGCDFALEQGAYRITRILAGASWDVDARGPLGEHGVDVHAGDWLLAVDGVPLDPAVDPWAAFVGKAGRVVTLTVSDKPSLDEDAREVRVEPVRSEAGLRYRDWVEQNRLRVEQASAGRIGYVHVPDTGQRGQNELHRQFFGQIDKAAMILDERWNAGGQVPTRFVELLNRPATNYWAIRDSRPLTWPFDGHQGPKCMLINQRAGSGGDALPYYFRQAGLGPLIGVRTWGGLVGISGLPPMIDGAEVTVPNFAFYETDGTWGVEGHGVEPDVEVVDDPTLMVDGTDPQLEKAIELMLAELEAGGATPPVPIPPYPDRSGMGVPEDER